MSPIWPSADFQVWPGTRIGALFFNLFIIILLLIPKVRTAIKCAFFGKHCTLVGPCIVGCVAGLFLHFIPCIWWTCDWGEHDGESIRGGIWFITWGGFTVFGCMFNCRRKMEMKGKKEALMNSQLGDIKIKDKLY